jgi:hypothetical protein
MDRSSVARGKCSDALVEFTLFSLNTSQREEADNWAKPFPQLDSAARLSLLKW